MGEAQQKRQVLKKAPRLKGASTRMVVVRMRQMELQLLVLRQGVHVVGPCKSVSVFHTPTVVER